MRAQQRMLIRQEVSRSLLMGTCLSRGENTSVMAQLPKLVTVPRKATFISSMPRSLVICFSTGGNTPVSMLNTMVTNTSTLKILFRSLQKLPASFSPVFSFIMSI